MVASVEERARLRATPQIQRAAQACSEPQPAVAARAGDDVHDVLEHRLLHAHHTHPALQLREPLGVENRVDRVERFDRRVRLQYLDLPSLLWIA